MNFTGQPIPLPIDGSIMRCLGMGLTYAERCPKAKTCAAHQSILHDTEYYPAAVCKCGTDKFVAYLPVGGFEREVE